MGINESNETKSRDQCSFNEFRLIGSELSSPFPGKVHWSTTVLSIGSTKRLQYRKAIDSNCSSRKFVFWPNNHQAIDECFIQSLPNRLALRWVVGLSDDWLGNFWSDVIICLWLIRRKLWLLFSASGFKKSSIKHRKNWMHKIIASDLSRLHWLLGWSSLLFLQLVASALLKQAQVNLFELFSLAVEPKKVVSEQKGEMLL